MATTILMVEDDKYIALALKIRLQAEGYDVTVAYSCEAAMKHVSEQVPAIALFDYNLPDGNGLDLINTLMKDLRTSSISAMVMTASKKPGLRDQAMAQGVVGYFEKPFKSAELIETIKELDLLDGRMAG